MPAVAWERRSLIEQDPSGETSIASAAADQGSTEPITRADVVAALPPGTTVVPVRRGTAALRTVDGIGRTNAVAVDATNPLTRGYLTMLEGRAPAGATEVALTRQAVTRLGAGIGGTVTTSDSKHTFTVVGLVEFPSMLEEVVLFAPVTGELPAYLSLDEQWLVDTPAPIGWSAVLALNRLGMVVASREVFNNPPPADQIPFYQQNGTTIQDLGIEVLIGGLALLEIILLAGPAFAVSARRRQRQLALVAANGGTPAHVRRMVLADGVVLGTVGAITGIAAGAGVAVLARPYVEEYLAHFRAGGYRFFPTALAVIAVLAVVTGLLAALVPAFITARQDVVASLAGRRGVTRSRKRWILLGAAMAAIGVAVVVYGTQRIDATVMLVGLVLAELGLVLCTPALVGLVARIGRVLPLAPRIALRDAARNRASAAPAISAVMAAVAGSVAIGLYFDSSQAQQREHLQISMVPGSVYVYTQAPLFNKTFSPDGTAIDPAVLAATAAAERANAATAETAARARPPGRGGPDGVDRRLPSRGIGGGALLRPVRGAQPGRGVPVDGEARRGA